MEFVTSALMGLWETSGIALFISNWPALIMVGIACFLLYLAIVKGFEPLLLLPPWLAVTPSRLPCPAPSWT